MWRVDKLASQLVEGMTFLQVPAEKLTKDGVVSNHPIGPFMNVRPRKSFGGPHNSRLDWWDPIQSYLGV